MKSLTIIDGFNPFKHPATRLASRGKSASRDQFCFDRFKEALCYRVVPTVSFSTHTRYDFIELKELSKSSRGKFFALIRMMNESPLRLAIVDCGLHGAHRNLGTRFCQALL